MWMITDASGAVMQVVSCKEHAEEDQSKPQLVPVGTDNLYLLICSEKSLRLYSSSAVMQVTSLVHDLVFGIQLLHVTIHSLLCLSHFLWVPQALGLLQGQCVHCFYPQDSILVLFSGDKLPQHSDILIFSPSWVLRYWGIVMDLDYSSFDFG